MMIWHDKAKLVQIATPQNLMFLFINNIIIYFNKKYLQPWNNQYYSKTCGREIFKIFERRFLCSQLQKYTMLKKVLISKFKTTAFILNFSWKYRVFQNVFHRGAPIDRQPISIGW